MKLFLLLASAAAAAAVAIEPLGLPGGAGGIGFDDLRFSVELRKVLVPGGRTGRLDLVDPETRSVEGIAGFSAAATGGGGHSEGTTSADAGDGFLFASDRTRRTLNVLDPGARRIVASVKLGGEPDYVRWVAPLREVWVSEPGESVIERFRLERAPGPGLTRTGAIRVPDGPESLEIDAVRRRAYSNGWHGETVAIDLDAGAVIARWPNGCKGARGLALDARRGLAFVGCAEGAAVALDVARGGRVVGRAPAGTGVDVIAFSEKLSHLYVPGAGSASLTVLGVEEGGALRVIGAVPTAPDAHCVTADDAGRVYVCDPRKGQLLVFADPYPSSR